MKNSMAFLAGGVAIGVAIGLLVAPKTGQEMRAAIRGKTDSVKEKLISAKARYDADMSERV